ncbi:MAG: peptide deformylase, partial [Bacilli bacterium]
LQLSGLHSIVFQHEIDHLNGIMFFDRISKDDPFKAPENSIALDR